MKNLPAPNSPLFVSVIIPVFNDSERLKHCLESLENQSYSKDHYEIIVVDNASQEDLQNLVKQYPQAKYGYEDKPGAYASRNKGISMAKGDIVGFTDSDCIPDKNWIGKAVEIFRSNPSCGLVVGSIELFFQNPDCPTAVELYESVTAFQQERNVEVNHWGATANVFTFKAVIQKVGLFDETLKSGGDIEWGQRIFAAGYFQIYAKECAVLHPARHSFEELIKKIVRVAEGRHARLKEKAKYPHQQFGFKDDLLSAVTRALRPPIKSAFNIFRSKELKNISQKTQVVFVLLIVRYVSAWTKIRVSISSH
ncbi:MAG: glycosyltransferase [Tildeniella torsiva UHER 1998/13D]|jgi:glycosyltransferase involved in cell wall biosynthesis|nr:glycosyltransferase [Tildeniella torsiva UHER 1998/13D]